nr:twin-arginine translocation signal domain-containing protein [Liberibacter crescens]
MLQNVNRRKFMKAITLMTAASLMAVSYLSQAVAADTKAADYTKGKTTKSGVHKKAHPPKKGGAK